MKKTILMPRGDSSFADNWRPPNPREMRSALHNVFSDAGRRIRRFSPALIAAVMLTLAPMPAQAAGEGTSSVAVINVAEVIDSSIPGRAGQKYVTNLKAKLESEFAGYQKSVAADKDSQAKINRKQAELTIYFRSEFDRVTRLVTAELSRFAAEWLKTNQKGVTVIIPANTLIAARPEVDISREMLEKLNGVKIDFAAGAPKGGTKR